MATAADVGLDKTQFGHAQAIIAAVKARSLHERAAQIAIEVALTESGLRVYANRNVPESLKLPHEAVGQDHLSVGIFQQQTPMWGSCSDCMGVATSTAKFLNALGKVNWQSMSNWMAAQSVQRSAFSDGRNYRAHDRHAGRIVAALWGTASLLSDTPSWYHRLLSVQKPMLRGADVSTVQHKVGCPADGVYGPVTKAHVQTFQGQHRLTTDGVVGPITARALRS
jgi:peptidoglycan hydrolase-like protein with peptidoglycan-binding domain